MTAATAVLDAAALVRYALDVTPDSRNQLSNLGRRERSRADRRLPRGVAATEDEVRLPRQVFIDALDELAEAGLPVVQDRERAWRAFADERSRYEALLLTLAGFADAVPTTVAAR